MMIIAYRLLYPASITGHGPFSHMFDALFIPKVLPDTTWKVSLHKSYNIGKPTCVSKPLRLLYSSIIYEIVNFLYSLFTLCYFFLYLKSVPIHVIVHV